MSCNQILAPLMTKAQVAECKKCKWASARKRWCGRFGIWIQKNESRIVLPNDRLARPAGKGEGCCDGERTIGQQAKDMAEGYANLARGKKLKSTDSRARTCETCDERTWMSEAEYTAWLLRNGIKVLRNFTQLEKLPKLPKYEKSPKHTGLYCRICKCFIEAKTRTEKARCQLGKPL